MYWIGYWLLVIDYWLVDCMLIHCRNDWTSFITMSQRRPLAEKLFLILRQLDHLCRLLLRIYLLTNSLTAAYCATTHLHVSCGLAAHVSDFSAWKAELSCWREMENMAFIDAERKCTTVSASDIWCGEWHSIIMTDIMSLHFTVCV